MDSLAREYDPYSPPFSDPSVLNQKFDWVVSQDVIEHVDDPERFLQDLQKYVAPQGHLVFGTPYSDNVDLQDPADQAGVLHPPFHRFLFSRQRLDSFFQIEGWKAEFVHKSYRDSWFPFVNTLFQSHLFLTGKSLDFAFQPFPVVFKHLLQHPSLIFWGLFGFFLKKNQDLVVILNKQ